jgi:hypothetical protein
MRSHTKKRDAVIENAPVRLRVAGILFGAVLLVAGCSDKALPTQPPPPTGTLTPAPTRTPTPTPGTVASTVLVDGTLSRISPPPAGFKHAARADMVVKNWGVHPVRLTRIETSDWYGLEEVLNGGFTPFAIAAGQTASFSVTLKSNANFDCSLGVVIRVYVEGQVPNYHAFGCEVVDWPF